MTSPSGAKIGSGERGDRVLRFLGAMDQRVVVERELDEGFVELLVTTGVIEIPWRPQAFHETVTRRAVEHHAVPAVTDELECLRVLATFRGGELATGQIEVLRDRRGVGPRDERETQRRCDRHPFADLDPRAERLWRTGDGEHHHVVTDARAGEAPEPEVAREAFHLRERVVDGAVPAPRRRAEPDQPRAERVGTGAWVAADETALLERARRRSARWRSSGRCDARCRRATRPTTGPPRAGGAPSWPAARCSTSEPPSPPTPSPCPPIDAGSSPA